MNIAINIEYILNISEKIFTSNISIFLITIIAGLFGFIIASIPLTMQLLEIKGNRNIDKINDNTKMKEKIFNSYIGLIKISFYLFTYILCIEFLKIIPLYSMILILSLIIYIILIFFFLRRLYKLIVLLKNLIDIYIE
jgi:MFS family permease